MILYLYALADALDRVEGVMGICGEATVLIPVPAAVLVGGWIEKRPAIDRESLTRQDALVRRIHAISPAVLPMRFGTSVADIEAATRAVEAFGASVRERLDLVRNREQMTLRVTGALGATGATGTPGAVRFSGATGATGAAGQAGQAGEAGAGRRYLERLASRSVPQPIQPIVDAVAPLTRARRIDVGRTEVVTVYHLIDRGSADAYKDAVNRCTRERPELTVRISGPSPAYAFADLGRL